MFQRAFIVGQWAVCCKISISQEWSQNLFQTIHFSIQTPHSIPSLGVHQFCQTCHAPLPCIPLWMGNFSKYYTAFCKAFPVWESFDKARGSSALSIQPQEKGKALGGWGHLWGTLGMQCTSGAQIFFSPFTPLHFFSWKIFDTEAIICSLFYYPWLFSVI